MLARGTHGNPSHKILIVEDDESYRVFLELRLRAADCECTTASTHDDAIHKLREVGDFTIILLDYTMFGHGPQSVLERLKEFQDLPRIIGHSNMDRRQEFAALGVDAFFLKPLKIQKFLQFIEHIGDASADH